MSTGIGAADSERNGEFRVGDSRSTPTSAAAVCGLDARNFRAIR
ncbi:hypothetical protein [Mycolicibacterium fortuitum]|nr:hypothetical protein [Mycolicibacterium fortuitum]